MLNFASSWAIRTPVPPALEPLSAGLIGCRSGSARTQPEHRRLGAARSDYDDRRNSPDSAAWASRRARVRKLLGSHSFCPTPALALGRRRQRLPRPNDVGEQCAWRRSFSSTISWAARDPSVLRLYPSRNLSLSGLLRDNHGELLTQIVAQHRAM